MTTIAITQLKLGPALGLAPPATAIAACRSISSEFHAAQTPQCLLWIAVRRRRRHALHALRAQHTDAAGEGHLALPAMSLEADTLIDLASRGEAARFVGRLCAELALSKSHYHKLLIRLRDERALLQVFVWMMLHSLQTCRHRMQ